MTAVQAIRTAVFYVLFMGQTIVLAIVVGLIAMIWRRRAAAAWAGNSRPFRRKSSNPMRCRPTTSTIAAKQPRVSNWRGNRWWRCMPAR